MHLNSEHSSVLEGYGLCQRQPSGYLAPHSSPISTSSLLSALVDVYSQMPLIATLSYSISQMNWSLAGDGKVQKQAHEYSHLRTTAVLRDTGKKGGLT